MKAWPLSPPRRGIHPAGGPAGGGTTANWVEAAPGSGSAGLSGVRPSAAVRSPPFPSLPPLPCSWRAASATCRLGRASPPRPAPVLWGRGPRVPAHPQHPKGTAPQEVTGSPVTREPAAFLRLRRGRRGASGSSGKPAGDGSWVPGKFPGDVLGLEGCLGSQCLLHRDPLNPALIPDPPLLFLTPSHPYSF